MNEKYRDMLTMSRPVSKKHMPMANADRAAQFSPFAALTGYDAAIMETARLTDRKIEPDEDYRTRMDERLRILSMYLAERPEVTVTHFCKDARKAGGEYRRYTGRLKKMEDYRRALVFADGTELLLDDILEIESVWLQGPLQE